MCFASPVTCGQPVSVWSSSIKTKSGLSVEVWVAQDGEPHHQAYVKNTFQAYMRELEFRIDPFEDACINDYRKYGDYDEGLPLYIDKSGVCGGRFEEVMNDCCGHMCSD